MDLDRVRAGLHGTLCSLAVALDQLIDLLGGNLYRDVSAVSGGDGRSSLDGSACVLGVSFRTCVLQLDGYLGAFRVT